MLNITCRGWDGSVLFTLCFSICSLGELLQLIHKRSLLPTAYPVDPKCSTIQFMGSLPGNTRNLIDLSRLQEDILSIYIAGKPVITESSIGTLRIAFKFKEKSSLASLQLRYVHTYVGICYCVYTCTYMYMLSFVHSHSTTWHMCLFLSNSVRARVYNYTLLVRDRSFYLFLQLTWLYCWYGDNLTQTTRNIQGN